VVAAPPGDDLCGIHIIDVDRPREQALYTPLSSDMTERAKICAEGIAKGSDNTIYSQDGETATQEEIWPPTHIVPGCTG
jgi:hypothetical protein